MRPLPNSGTSREGRARFQSPHLYPAPPSPTPRQALDTLPGTEQLLQVGHHCPAGGGQPCSGLPPSKLSASWEPRTGLATLAFICEPGCHVPCPTEWVQGDPQPSGCGSIRCAPGHC